MANQLQPGVIYIDKTKFDLYIDGAESIISFVFPPNLVKDMEVLNKEQFTIQVTSFIQANTATQLHLIILLSENLLFQKDILVPTDEVNTPDIQQKAVQKFLDTVPFENVSSKVYPIEQGIKVIATNTDLYDTIRLAFEKNGSIIDSVIPVILIADPSTPVHSLNLELIGAIFSNAESIKTQSLVSAQEEELKNKKMQDAKNAPLSLKGKNGRAILLSIFMSVLLFTFVLLVVMINPFGTYRPKPSQSVSQSTVPNTVIPSATPTPPPIIPSPNTSIASGSAFTNVATIQIRIINTTDSPALALLLRSKLLESGFSTIDIVNNTSSSPANTLVVFEPTVPDTVKNTISTVVKNMFTTYTVQENTAPQTAVVITIANTK